jgi:sortase A
VTLPRPQIALQGAREYLGRLPHSRQANGLAGGLLLVIGAVLLATALMTIFWQDPVTAVFTQHEQKVLSAKLAAAEKAPVQQSTLTLVQRAESDPERIALLARDLAGRTKSGEPLGRIGISRMGVNFVFVSGVGKNSLKKGPGHYDGSPLPGLPGTVSIAGHRTTYSAPFRRMNTLRRGDEITLTMSYGRFTYRVEGLRVVLPQNTGVLKHVRHNRLVLTTCTPVDSAAKRLVTTARLVRAVARGPAITLVPTLPVAASPAR